MHKGIKESGIDAKHILCVCAHGNNRSVTMAHILKYVENFETLTAGLEYHTPETLKMLFEWADVIVVPDRNLLDYIPQVHKEKVKFYDIGEDVYPRPFNDQLYKKAKYLMDQNRII